MKRLACLAVAAAMVGLAGGCSRTSEKGGGAGQRFRVAVIPKGTTHEFWKSIHAGALKAREELAASGIATEIIWKGPLREDDREQQIQVVEGFISGGVSGIVLAPLDSRALVRPVEEAARAGIPTVIMDSGLESEKIASFVATDNHRGGVLAAQRLGALLGGKGNALLLRYQEGSASTMERERGFLEEMARAFPVVRLVSADQYAGPTRETAYRAAQNLLHRHGGDLQGVFCPNESSTAGMLLALQEMKRAGKVSFVGFDSSQAFVDAMRTKQLHGLVLQSPFNMGYLSVMTMVRHLQGLAIESRVDTGAVLVTPDNLDSPESQALLHPPLDRYLK